MRKRGLSKPTGWVDFGLVGMMPCKRLVFLQMSLILPFEDSLLIGKLIELTRELGRFTTKAERQLKRRSDSSFPSHNTFDRLGSKRELIAHLLDFCSKNKGYEDVQQLLSASILEQSSDHEETAKLESEEGFVYLIRVGRFYKIGRTNALGRREREVAIQLPDRAITVHYIKPDDPVGIEAYWHKRFAAKRGNGEWFELSSEDVHVFKRRKFM